MSLISALFSGVSGLSGNSQALNVIGDNIANVNTVGYKGSKAVFGDILSVILNNGATNLQVGRGSKLQSVLQSFNQGSFESSSNALDIALDGSGFFITKNSANGNFYTRAGQFRLDDAGKVVSTNKDVLQGFEITSGTAATTLSDVDLAGVQSAPNASTEFTLGANLNGAASAATTFTSPITLYNSVGSQVVLNINFTKQAGSNTWRFAATPSVGTVTSGASGTLSFNTSGQLSAVNGGALADLSIGIDYSSANPPAAAQTLTWKLVDSAGATNG
ncbi:MAG: flagellar hook-basal body complex protein, partial [Nitrospinae bacterium]|nr:flagellar hook-basal body complex protein [Nitrospinota bacterium]